MQKLYLARQAFPSAKHVGVLCNTEHSTSVLREFQVACSTYQFEPHVFNARDLMGLRSSFEQMIKSGNVDLVWMVTDDVANQKFGRRFISEKCIALKIPLFVTTVDDLREGALFTIASDESNTLKIFVNKKVMNLMSFAFPAEVQSKLVVIE